MAIDFPNSPTIGQQFIVNNRSWVWLGTRWESIIIPAGSVPSQAVVANQDIYPNVKYFVNTTNPITLTLPAEPMLGDEIFIYDANGQASVNNITILRNGTLINGLAENAVIDVDQSISLFAYTGPAIGWRFE